MSAAALAPISCADAHHVGEVEARLRGLLEVLDPDAVPVFDAPDLWSAFDRVERLAASAKALLARRVADACTWRRAGFRSAADQLASWSGTSVGSARSLIETSQRVAELPATAAALREGRLSGAKVEAIAAAATIAPDAEAGLLAVAQKMPLGVLRKDCLRARARTDRDAAHARIREGRFLREYTDGEGGWNVVGRGVADAGAEFRAALDPIVDEFFKAARAEGRRESREAYAFEALIELARRAAGTQAGAGGGGDAAGGAAAPKAKPVRNFGLLRIDYDTFVRGAVVGDETCDLPGLGPIPVRTARELLGDAILKLVITKGVDVMSVTHLGRSPTVAQQVALWWQSPVCRVEGCGHTFRLENDHCDDWAFSHQTRFDGLDPLCEHHHDLKNLHGWALVAGTGTRPMVPSDDPRHPNHRAPPEPH